MPLPLARDSRDHADVPPWRSTPWKTWIVLPAYNESENLGPLLERIDTDLQEAGIPFEVILSDDGSTDDTASVVTRYQRYIPIHVFRHEKNQGLGATIRDGLIAAVRRCGDRDIVIAMDADNTHTPGLIQSLIRVVREGGDIVIASRYQPGAQQRGVPAHRRLLSLGAAWLFRAFFPIPGVKDYTCGYRAYRATVLKAAFEKYGDQFVNQTGFQCMVDILLKLRPMGLVFREVPLILRYDNKRGASKLKVAKTVAQTLKLIARRALGR